MTKSKAKSKPTKKAPATKKSSDVDEHEKPTGFLAAVAVAADNQARRQRQQEEGSV